MALAVGDEESLEVLVTPEDVRTFASLSGDDAPLHTDPAFARAQGFSGTLVHGALLAAYVSRLIGTKIPGARGLLERMDLAFRSPVHAPCRLTLTGRVRQVSESVGSVSLDVTVADSEGRVVASGKTYHRILSEQPAG